MRAPTKPKPNAAVETARVMNIYGWIMDDLRRREPQQGVISVGKEPPVIHFSPLPAAVIAVAERIAARTED